VVHRDIKPDNLGVRPDPTDRRPRLVLFDFSLADEPLEHVKAGTPPYLDPFLGAGRRPRYDRAAERFAIAVTLFEMATGTRPVWGSGGADPATITDEVTLTPDLFEPDTAAGMIAFFRKALARDAGQRHGDLAELAQAWAALFTAADARSPQVDEDRPGDEVEVSASTPLDEAGLSARARSAVARLGVVTVGELLGVSPFRINSIPGLGDKTRRELQRKLRQWRRALDLGGAGQGAGTQAGEEQGEQAGQRRGIDAIVTAFVPTPQGRSHSEVQCAQVLVGLQAAGTDGWPNLSAVAEAIGVTPGRVSQIVDRLRKPWSRTSIDTGMDAQVQDILAGLGGVAEASEVARALLATCGSAAVEPDRTRQALGVVRAVVEADLTRGGDSAIASRRHGPRVILALEPADPDAPAADAVIDWVRRLAQAADRLAATRPIPVRATALASLRAIKAPVGVDLNDERLLRIAAAASSTAAVGGRGEIYPRGMSAAEAIRLTLAGLAAARLQLTPQALAERVRGRFPEADEIPERPALDRIVQECDAGLAWNGTAYASTTATSASLLSTEHGRTVLGTRHAGPRFDEIDARLKAALASDGYLTLAVDPRRQQQATQVLAAEYGLAVVNLTDLLLDAARALATSSGVDWGFLLSVDAQDSASPDRVQLNHFVATALDQAMPKVLANNVPLLLTEPAPLGRYRQQHWLATLADLTTQRPAARWLLVPHRDSAGAPTLDAQVPVPLGADGFLSISIDFLDRHAMQADAS